MPTVCTEFDVTQLTEHLIGSVTYLGARGPCRGRRQCRTRPDDGLLDRLIAFTGRNLH
jgi:hypothetical protein